MTPRHRGNEQQQHRHHHEMDPLLIKEASTLSSKNTKEYEEETVCCGLTTKRQLRKVIPMILGLVACCFVVGIVAWKINNPLVDEESSSSSESPYSSSSGHHHKKKSKKKHRNKFFRPTTPTTTQQRIKSYTDPNNKYGYAEFVLLTLTSKEGGGEGGEFVVHYSEDVIAAAAAPPPNNKQVATTTTTTTPTSTQDQEETDSGGSSGSGSEVVEADKINSDGDGGGKYNDDDDDATLDTTTTAAAAAAPEDVEEQPPSQHFNTNNNRTFGELARILLPPWHMASVIAVDASILDDTQPSNHTLKQARQVLKIGRDLLDVFSPCYDSRTKKSKKSINIWKKLRNLYSDGYEQVGYYKDLSAAHLVYDEPLWTQRLDDILVWKEKFLDFDVRHDIIKFMVDEIKDPSSSPPPMTTIGGGSGGGSSGGSGGFEHKQSHLFWGEELSSSHQLPRSTDPATESFDKLIKTQLQNALQYYDIIVMYDTVLTKEEQEDYHNLRKELRDVVDEFNLLGFGVLLPNPTSSSTRTADKSVRKFKLAVHKIGIFHDEWTAYDKYKTNGEHFGKQQKLELSINEKWTDFKAWMFKVDFRGTIEALLEELE